MDDAPHPVDVIRDYVTRLGYQVEELSFASARAAVEEGPVCLTLRNGDILDMMLSVDGVGSFTLREIVAPPPDPT